MNNFIKAMEKGCGYEFMIHNYDELSKIDMRNIILQCLFNMDKEQWELITDVLKDNLVGSD